MSEHKTHLHHMTQIWKNEKCHWTSHLFVILMTKSLCCIMIMSLCCYFQLSRVLTLDKRTQYGTWLWHSVCCLSMLHQNTNKLIPVGYIWNVSLSSRETGMWCVIALAWPWRCYIKMVWSCSYIQIYHNTIMGFVLLTTSAKLPNQATIMSM